MRRWWPASGARRTTSTRQSIDPQAPLDIPAANHAGDTKPLRDNGAPSALVGAPAGIAMRAGAQVSNGLAHARRGWLWALQTWLVRVDVSVVILLAIAAVALVPRLYGLNWDANNHLHPDEREIVFKAICLSLPGTPRPAGCDPAYTGPGWLLSPSSPLNPHFFAYGSFPLYLLAAVAHGLAWLAQVTGGCFLPPDGGTWTDFNHFALVGRALSALFDGGSVLLAGLIGRRLMGRWAGVVAAAFVAVIPFEVQVAHFYAVDTVLLFCVLATLLACVALAQGTSSQRFGTMGSWWVGLLIGVAYGLALATKVSALPLGVPIVVALVLRWRRRGLEEAVVALLGIVGAVVLTFMITSPYALIDWSNFRQQVNEQTALSQGTLDYPYVRQFAGTQPFLYQLRQLLLFDMGLPLGVAGLVGAGWAIARLWRSLDNDWAIVISWCLVYFAVIGSSYTKFTRYMLPIFAPLAICAACMLVALAHWGERHLRVARMQRLAAKSGTPLTTASGSAPVPLGMARLRWRSGDVLASGWSMRITELWGIRWWRAVCIGLGATVLACALIQTLAIDSIYSAPNSRVQASEWIYNHVPAGATLTNEVWDDPLPISVPAARYAPGGMPLTAAGHPIDASQYGQIGLNLYDDDTPQKADQLSRQLATANVVVISSQRLLRSIPKLPDRYPMTIRYYQLLFAGRLGFKPAEHVQIYPHFGPFVLNDSTADESFSVYDHPPVWIFVREGSGLTAAQIKTRLTQGITLPAPTTRSGSQKSLLLTPAATATNASSAPLAVQFSPTSLANHVPLLWWLVVVELLGLVAYPLAFSAFPGLRDRGWGLSKLLGLLLLAWAIWLPASLGVLPFDHWVVVLMFLVVAAAGALVGWRRRVELLAFVRARWRLLVLGEALFLGAFLFFTWVRALDPDLWHIYRGGEKPMELAFLNAILRSRSMPPADPWFSGGYINYYYYGQYVVAVLIKLTGITPTVAFNLALPLLFAMTFTGAFSLVLGVTRRWWAGVLGAAALVVIGNLDGLLQLIGQWQAVLAGLVPPAFDFWRSSRIIPYTINEFPYWSYLYGDLHAHLIDLPVVVLIIAGCASLLLSARQDGRRWRPAWPTLAALALALGAAWCINTWDVPTYALLIVVVVILRLLTGARHGTWRNLSELLNWPVARGLVLALVATFAGTYALYAPFHAAFQNFTSGIGPVTTPTNPLQFATIFGLWIFIAISYFAAELRDRWLRWTRTSGSAGQAYVGLGWGVATTGVLLLLLMSVAGVKFLMVLLIAAGVFVALDARRDTRRLFTALLLVLGLCVALGVEVVYLRDFLDNSDWQRMNTVFKFYYQVWTLLSLGGALALTSLLLRLSRAERVSRNTTMAAVFKSERVRGGYLPSLGRGAWMASLCLLVAGSLVFLVEGTAVRVQDPTVWATVQPPPGGIQPRGLSLDGMAYMRGWYPDDYAGITWLNEHVAGTPTIVEASDGPYMWYGRVSIYTGLPSVMGWSSHESQQRYPSEVYQRQTDVQNFYSTSDPNVALAFLRQYGVKYVYLGGLERTCYLQVQSSCVPLSAAASAKFKTLVQHGVLRTVYTQGRTTIYQVVG